ncbi:hypothetical protein DMB38_12355 [Streptomyces sp. WAC 06738]|uniref:hypothetical protein n=1 Tax=Streptomyces sp. WAC 06738 TaxID=2203210 RepID=UPI000F6D08F9|nr:hypothetical protein [Streptomyces sp. WAC 06738]AZM46504.1 hypothetical protein DMB38_12355 [Streptomyces sp. WAC 06738]
MVPTFAATSTAGVAAHTQTGASTSAQASQTASEVWVVAPGERVQAAPKVQLWLTEDGKHWSTPDQPNQFRSVVDGNLDLSRPGVSLQAEQVEGHYFLSGFCTTARGTYPASRWWVGPCPSPGKVR